MSSNSTDNTLDTYASLQITSESAARIFNSQVKKRENKIPSEAIQNITKDIYYRLNVGLLRQNRKINTLARPNKDGSNIQDPIRASDPWQLDLQADESYENSSMSYLVKGSEKTISCHSCDGKGENLCPTCRGQGWTYCTTCSGQGQNKCYQCNGSGAVLCPRCRGINSVVETSSAKKKGVVSRAVLGGVIAGPVGAVLGGATAKTQTVTSSQMCPTCYGKGAVVCQSCHGTGAVVCSGCRGERRVQCRTCKGSRNLICQECEGRGDLIEYQEVIIQNDFINRSFEINPFQSEIARQMTPASLIELELQADNVPFEKLDGVSEGEFPKLKRVIDNALMFGQGRLIKSKVSIASLPVIRVTFVSRGKQKDFKLVGRSLAVEKPSLYKLIDFPLFPTRLYGWWQSVNLLRKILICSLSFVVLALLIFFLIR